MSDASKPAGGVPGLFSRPDALLLDTGADGELLVARVRALLSLLVLSLPLLAALDGDGREVAIGLAAAVVVNASAQLWLALARRRVRWLPLATATHDVSVTTLVLVLLARDDPAAGLNSMVVWCFYAVAIVLTALRNDVRLALYTGALAIAQYAALWWLVTALAPGDALPASYAYGVVSLGTLGQRLVLLAIVTGITAVVVRRIQRLITVAGHDALTGLPNRAWLLQHLPQDFADARASGRSLSVALLDLDGFRRINEVAGHPAGDRALRHVAAGLSGLLHEGEHAARIGGQEFVLLLRSPIGSAWERLDGHRRLLAERPFQPGRGRDGVTLRFSAGLAAWPQDGGDASALLGVADRRLKQAKADGGDRVVARER
ncbi:GGDEF domain-containing protein [Luteimonas yindakuii]|uniref:diguanylate cyclase n=1 Tax=Luteimonas yindakuii TaxID=2565782 RepID=A0A4Z1R2K2_9GAMM|nr:GGDEF domain-containing protein [Luteimonas yindakuii]TKS52765.1 GGDEF domain-containing protein [Luteimonas yindakuii]